MLRFRIEKWPGGYSYKILRDGYSVYRDRNLWRTREMAQRAARQKIREMANA